MSIHLSSTEVFDSDVLIGPQSVTPDVKLHVIESGTKVTPYTDTVLALQNSTASTTNCVLNMIAGNQGNCDLWFGDTDSPTVGYVQWGNANNVLTIGRSGGVATFNSDGVTVTGTSASQLVQTTSGNRLTSSNTLPSGVGFTGTSASQVVQTDGSNNITSSNSLPLVKTKAGTGTATPRIGGMLYEDHNSATNSGTGEDDLKTFTLPANTLANDGDTLLIHATGALDTTIETKTLKFYFCGLATTLVSSSDISKHWDCTAIVQRTGVTAANISIVYHQGSPSTLGTPSSLIKNTSGTISTLASDQVIKFTAEASATSVTTQFDMQIIYYPAYDA